MVTTFALETVDDSGEARGQLSLALGPDGVPRVAYATTRDNPNVRIARRTDSGWTRDDLPTGSIVANDDSRVCLAVDSTSRLHVGYEDRESSHLVYAVRKDTWEFEIVPIDAGLFPASVGHVSLQLHPGRQTAALRDTPNFAVHNRQRQSLVHATKIDGTWRKNVTTVELPPESDGIDLPETGLWPSLGFDRNDIPRIAYIHLVRPNLRFLKLATLIAEGQVLPDGTVHRGGWVLQTIDPQVPGGEFVSMANGTTGRNLVSYFDLATASLKAWIRTPLEGIEPRVETVAAGVVPRGSATRAVSAAADRRAQEEFAVPSFRVAYAAGALRFATRARNGTWSSQTVDEAGTWPALAYDRDGTAHLAYVKNRTVQYARGTE